MPKESNVTLVPHITFIRPNTLLVKAVMTLFWVNTKRKTVMTLIRIVLLSNGCAVITLFKIYLKRVMTDPFTFECHYSLLDHVKLKLQSWLSFGTMFFTSVESWLSLGPLLSQSVLPLPSFRTCLSFGTREYIFHISWQSTQKPIQDYSAVLYVFWVLKLLCLDLQCWWHQPFKRYSQGIQNIISDYVVSCLLKQFLNI